MNPVRESPGNDAIGSMLEIFLISGIFCAVIASPSISFDALYCKTGLFPAILKKNFRIQPSNFQRVTPDIKKTLKNGGNIEAAAQIGKRIAEKAKKIGITNVAFDRSGYRYHGRVKALADAARENGLSF